MQKSFTVPHSFVDVTPERPIRQPPAVPNHPPTYGEIVTKPGGGGGVQLRYDITKGQLPKPPVPTPPIKLPLVTPMQTNDVESVPKSMNTNTKKSNGSTSRGNGGFFSDSITAVVSSGGATHLVTHCLGYTYTDFEVVKKMAVKPRNFQQSSQTSIASTTMDFRNWDVFRLLPQKSDGYESIFMADFFLQILKLVVFVLSGSLLLGSAVVAKGALLLMTSGIGWSGHNFTLCNNPNTIGAYSNNTVLIETKHVVKWVWSVYITICMPEVFCFIRCLHRVCFRSVKKPSAGQFFFVFFVESFHAVGVGMLVFKVLPGLDAVTGAMLTNCLCVFPALLTLLSRKPGKLTVIFVILDIVCIGAQSSGFWAWPVFIPELSTDAWAVPISILLCSIAWWENFVHPDSIFPCIQKLAKKAQRLKLARSKTYVVISVWKCAIYFCALFAFTSMRMTVNELLEPDPFGAKPINVIVWRPSDKVGAGGVGGVGGGAGFANITDWDKLFEPTIPPVDPHQGKGATAKGPLVIDVADLVNKRNHTDPTVSNSAYEYAKRTKRQAPGPMNGGGGGGGGGTSFRHNQDKVVKVFHTSPYDAIWVVVVQVLSAFFCYQCGKFTCKVMMQRLSFALPLNLTVPVTVFILVSFCTSRSKNNCFLTETLPYEMFWRYYPPATVQEFFTTPQTWVWLVWLLSQIWITIHVWFPKCERLADTDRIFVTPYYNGAFVDQSLSLNRRRDDKMKIKTEDIELDGEDGTSSSLYETIPAQAAALTPQTKSPSVFSDSSSKCKSANIDPSRTADAISKIYACATMWHETATEMLNLLKSIFRLDEDQCARRNAQKYLKIVDPDYYEFEAHIFFDDAFEINEFGEPVVNSFVKQFLEVVDVAAGDVHQTAMRVKAPKKYSAPYGGRLVWTLPGKNKLIAHLKDKQKIRVRKRWSQVMYMYYLLGHKLMEKVDDFKRKETIAENTYILTLDGDVDFKPSAVQLLVDLMKKNRKLGAACGRIHPRGSGPMVWYQQFEYAIGHWFQKATEHMIGCVLCAPGCFSLFRAAALMDDDVVRKYATKADKAKDNIQYDQGEDRWLCTLLLQRGYRVEYCAASDALTFAPEGFNEFFNQRRRWIPSTVANIIDLLMDYKNVVGVNDSISIWYVLYQFAMLVSSILGPGTIFLMVIGAVNISFNMETYFSFILVFLPVLLFIVVCLTCKSDTQLLLAQIIGALYALLMMAVIVGTALQIKKDGIYSPHAIFLLAVIFSFFLAAVLHPMEFTCVIPGILYFLAIPCMYMLLIIYSVCNLHVVSWGTREVKSKDDPKAKKGRIVSLLEKDHGDPGEFDGVYSVGCGNICRFMCCLQPSAIGQSPQMVHVSHELAAIKKEMEKLTRAGPLNRRSSLGFVDNKQWDNQLIEEDEPIDDNFDLPYHGMSEQEKIQLSEAWLNDKCVRHAERDNLDDDETRFWKEMIEKYLYPLTLDRHYQERVTLDLIDLRNKVTFAFFMMNALFVLIVFLLQIKKDCLHIEWPIGPLVNHTIVPCDSDTGDPVWVLSRLQLEPIGLVFLIFFMSLLLLQFVAMMMHRFGTLSHILASTELFCFKKPLDKLSEDEIVVQNAVEIARELQAIRGIDEDGTASVVDAQDETISRRRVVKNLESSRKSMMKKRTETLDAAFRKRFFRLSACDNEAGVLNVGNLAETPVLGLIGSGKRRLTMRKGTLRALEMRRNSVFGTLDQRHFAGGPTDKRGPSKRRLDKLFNQKSGNASGGLPNGNNDEPLTASSSSAGDSSDDDERRLQQQKLPTSSVSLGQSTKDDAEKIGGKKMAPTPGSAPNMQISSENNSSRSNLLQPSRQSSNASANAESHF